jgi:hypothetical protein
MLNKQFVFVSLVGPYVYLDSESSDWLMNNTKQANLVGSIFVRLTHDLRLVRILRIVFQRISSRGL